MQKGPSKSDISLHSGIKALCTRADTWSLSPCQRGLASGLRCMEELREFTPPTSCLTHNHTQAIGSPGKDRLLPQVASLNHSLHPYRPRDTHTHTHKYKDTHFILQIPADSCMFEQVPDRTHYTAVIARCIKWCQINIMKVKAEHNPFWMRTSFLSLEGFWLEISTIFCLDEPNNTL